MNLLWVVLTIATLECTIGSVDTIHGRIVGGVDARARQFPFFAQLSVILPAIGESHERVWCGGSIISRRHVLTNAHCMPPASWYLENATFHVYVGRTKIKKNGMLTGEQRILVKKIFNHEKYQPTVRVNDIAVLELAHPIEFTDTVQKVQLSDADFEKESYRNEDCYMIGYGLTGWTRNSDFTVTGPNPQIKTLQTTSVNVEANHVCDYFHRHSVFYKKILKRSQLCTATLEGRKACNGDSGSPIVCRDQNGVFRQIAVMSTGWDFHCSIGINVNMRISYYRPWIANILA